MEGLKNNNNIGGIFHDSRLLDKYNILHKLEEFEILYMEIIKITGEIWVKYLRERERGFYF